MRWVWNNEGGSEMGDGEAGEEEMGRKRREDSDKGTFQLIFGDVKFLNKNLDLVRRETVLALKHIIKAHKR